MTSVIAAMTLALGLKKPLKIDLPRKKEDKIELDTSSSPRGGSYITVPESLTPKSDIPKIDRSFSFSLDRTEKGSMSSLGSFPETYDSEEDS